MMRTTRPRITMRIRDFRAPADVAIKWTFLLYWLRPSIKTLSRKRYPATMKRISKRAVAYLARLGERGTASKKTLRPMATRKRISGNSKALTRRSSRATLDFWVFTRRYFMAIGIREKTSPSQIIKAPDGIPQVLSSSMAFPSSQLASRCRLLLYQSRTFGIN
jgi:hypothetical protein